MASPKTLPFGAPVADVGSEASAIDVVQLGIDDSQVNCLASKKLKAIRRVVFKVLVADIADLILLEHQGQITHLNDPQPIRIHGVSNIRTNLLRIFQIVEHGDAGDDFGPMTLKDSLPRVSIPIKKISDHVVCNLARQRSQILCGIKTNPENASGPV